MSNANRIKAKTPGYCLQPFQYIFVWRWVLACMVKSTHTAHRHRHTHAFNDVYEQCSVCVCVYCIAFDRTIINNNPQRLPLIHSGDHIRFNWIWHSSYIIPRSSACRHIQFYFNFFPFRSPHSSFYVVLLFLVLCSCFWSLVWNFFGSTLFFCIHFPPVWKQSITKKICLSIYVNGMWSRRHSLHFTNAFRLMLTYITSIHPYCI